MTFDKLFAKPWPADGSKSNSVIPNEGVLGSNAFFDVREQGTGDTMGKGEVMFALQYGVDGDPTFRLDPGGIADLVSSTAGLWHVKDLTTSKNIALGKGDQINVLEDYFPIKLIKSTPGITPVSMGGKAYAAQWLKMLEKIVDAMESGNYAPLGEAPGNSELPRAGDSTDVVINKMQRGLDEVIRDSAGPMGPAEGIIFFKKGNAYVAGTDNISYVRGNGRGSVVGISPSNLGVDVGPMAELSASPSLFTGMNAALEMPAGKALAKRIADLAAQKKAEEEAKKKAEEEAEAQAGEEAEVEVDSEEEVISESDQNRWQFLAGIKE